MPNVAESPNFEAIIAGLANFPLTPQGGDFSTQYQVQLTSDAGLPLNAILLTNYQLTQDVGIPQGLIDNANFSLVFETAVNPFVGLLNITENVLEFPLLIVDKDLPQRIAPDNIDANFQLSASNDVVILASDIPASPVVEDSNDLAKIAQQEILLGIVRTCVPFENRKC
jgi:hypothetical protein